MRIIALFTIAAALWGQSPTFLAAMKSAEAKDYTKALPLMEKALQEDPESMRYASEYRVLVLQQAKALHPKEGSTSDFDRSLKFFETLSTAHPKSANAALNYGFAYVDKMPAAGAITQVIIANNALTQFTKSIEAKPSWIGYYTRGNSYLFWPVIFGKTKLGVADLEEAYKMQKAGPPRSYHVRVYVSLGDGYWKSDQLDRARAMWSEGLKQFPASAAIKDRLAKEGDELKTVIEDTLDPNKRVDTDLKELWSNP